MKKAIFLLCLFLYMGVVMAQEKRTSPKHPKGNTALQMQALVFYNSAVEQYNQGLVSEAKLSLKKAINTDFALTEAQLFLADILNEQGVKDSALYYYVSGCDFIIEQEPRYYFRLFKLGMDLGEYAIVKQYLKYFKKLYANKVAYGPYEKDFPYTVEDYNHYKESIDLIYNYKSWNGAFVLDQNQKGFNSLEVVRQTQRFESDSQGFLIESTSRNEGSELFIKSKKGKSYGEPQQIKGLESFELTTDPFVLVEKSLIYFAALKNGQYDLYVGKLNIEKLQIVDVRPLDRINTSKDERFPRFYNDTFYFASNGLPGFGGMDVFMTTDNERIDGYILPSNHYQMNSGVNSNKDEMAFGFDSNGSPFVIRDEKEGFQAIRLRRKEKREGIVYKITIEELN